MKKFKSLSILTEVLLLLSVFPFAFGNTKAYALVVTIVDVSIKNISNKKTMSVMDDMLNSALTLFLPLKFMIMQGRLISLRSQPHWLPFDEQFYLFLPLSDCNQRKQ